jgi:hypothetical protein
MITGFAGNFWLIGRCFVAMFRMLATPSGAGRMGNTGELHSFRLTFG